MRVSLFVGVFVFSIAPANAQQTLPSGSLVYGNPAGCAWHNGSVRRFNDNHLLVTGTHLKMHETSCTFTKLIPYKKGKLIVGLSCEEEGVKLENSAVITWQGKGIHLRPLDNYTWPNGWLQRCAIKPIRPERVVANYCYSKQFELSIKGRTITYGPPANNPHATTKITRRLQDWYGNATAYRTYSKRGGVGHLILQNSTHCHEASKKDRSLIQFLYADRKTLFEGCCEEKR